MGFLNTFPRFTHVNVGKLESVSSIRDIKPVDSRRPRHLTITFESNTGTAESTIEFDTDESAQDWRRELLGAFRPCQRQSIPVIIITITKQVHCSCIAGITVWS